MFGNISSVGALILPSGGAGTHRRHMGPKAPARTSLVGSLIAMCSARHTEPVPPAAVGRQILVSLLKTVNRREWLYHPIVSHSRFRTAAVHRWSLSYRSQAAASAPPSLNKDFPNPRGIQALTSRRLTRCVGQTWELFGGDDALTGGW